VSSYRRSVPWLVGRVAGRGDAGLSHTISIRVGWGYKVEGTLPTSDNLVVRNLGVDTREGKLSVSDVSIGEEEFASTVVHMHKVSVIAGMAARRTWDQSTTGVGCSRKVARRSVAQRWSRRSVDARSRARKHCYYAQAEAWR